MREQERALYDMTIHHGRSASCAPVLLMALVQFCPARSVLFARLRARSFSLFDTGARAPPHTSYDSEELEILRLIVQFRPLAL